MRSMANGIKLAVLDIDEIKPCPNQPRRYFDPQAMQELCNSIRCYGIVEPVCVRRVRGKYELIAGERRIRAARMAGIRKVPAVVRSINKEAAIAMTLIENMQRQGLSFFDEAAVCLRIIERCVLTRAELAGRLGIDENSLLAKIQALSLPDDVKDLILKYRLNEYHAVAIMKLNESTMQAAVVRIAGEQGLSPEKTRDLVDAIKNDNMNLLCEPKRKQVVKNEKIYLNTIKNTISMMNAAGVGAKTCENEDENFIRFTIEIKK